MIGVVFVRVFAASLLLLANGSAKAADQAGSALKFEWPATGSAWVNETSQNSRGSRVRRYKINLADGPKSGDISLRYSDFSIFSGSGDKNESARDKKFAEQVSAISALNPPSIIDKDGNFAGLGEFDFDSAINELMKSMQLLPELAQGIRSLKKSARIREKLYFEHAKNDWMSWVGHWVNRNLVRGASVSGMLQTTIATQQIPGTFDMTHHGSSTDCADCVRLTSRITLSGPKLRTAVIIQFTPPGGDLQKTSNIVDEVTKIIDMELITRASTMQTVRATAKAKIHIRLSNGELVEESEFKDYRFEWN